MGKSARSITETPTLERVEIEADSAEPEVTTENNEELSEPLEAANNDLTDEQSSDPPDTSHESSQEIVAIGKMVSSANGGILKGALDNLLKVAVTSGVLSEDELLAMFVKYDKVAEAVEEAEEADQQIEAGCLTDCTKSKVWQQTFQTIVDSFSSIVRDLSWRTPQGLQSQYQTEDLGKIYTGFVDELVPMLKEVGTRIDDIKHKPIDRIVMASSIDSGTELEMPIQLARGSNNKRSFSGTLFQVDRPSEGVPSVGPGVPLFVPREVAIKAIADVSGLPLDAKQGFGGHANKNIVGAMQRAELVGDEVVVHAQLFNWSQPEMVGAIAAEKQSLGMSMNANSLGRIRTLQDGTKVFHIDSLELLGANILRAKNATYSKTAVIAAENLQEPDDSDLESDLELDTESQPDDAEIEAYFDAIDTDVSASSTDCPITPDNDMDLQDLSSQISNFSDRVSDDMSVLGEQVQVLMADYNQRAAIQAAAIQAQQQNTNREDTRTLLKELIGELQASGAIPAPDRSARKTMPLSASVRGSSPAPEEGGESMRIQLQLAAVDAKIEELNNFPGADNLRLIELTEQKHQLMSMLSR